MIDMISLLRKQIEYTPLHSQITESKMVVVDKMIDILSENKRQSIGLKAVSKFLVVVFSSSRSALQSQLTRWCKVHMKEEPESTAQSSKKTARNVEQFDKRNKIIDFWCFSPAFG